MRYFRFPLFILMFSLSAVAAGQNLQITRGLDEAYLRAKFSMYKPDPWGSTYFETNAKYVGHQLSNTLLLITRYLNLWEQSPCRNLDIAMGYCGGSTNAGGVYIPIKSSFTVGAAGKLVAKDHSRMVILQIAYRKIAGGDTEVPLFLYSYYSWNNIMKINGFSLFGIAFGQWDDLTNRETGVRRNVFVVHATPSVWYNAGRLVEVDHLSVGIRMDVDYNFANKKGLKILPQAGIRWNFLSAK